MAANFASVLDTPMDSIERPKPVPTGSWIGQIVGLPTSREVTTKNGEQETLNISVKLVSPGQDVDGEALNEYGDYSSARPLQRTFWFSKPATPEEKWSFSQFVTNTLKIDTAGKSMKQVCAEMSGKQLLVTIGHTPGVDKNTNEAVIYSNITATAAL